MRRLEFDIGSKVWFHNGGPEKIKGVVVHVFEMYGEKQYVIEVETVVDPILEVRDGFALSDKKKKPIGLWRR